MITNKTTGTCNNSHLYLFSKLENVWNFANSIRPLHQVRLLSYSFQSTVFTSGKGCVRTDKEQTVGKALHSIVEIFSSIRVLVLRLASLNRYKEQSFAQSTNAFAVVMDGDSTDKVQFPFSSTIELSIQYRSQSGDSSTSHNFPPALLMHKRVYRQGQMCGIL